MERRIVQDIVPSERRTIREVLPVQNPRLKKKVSINQISRTPPPPPPTRLPPQRPEPAQNPRRGRVLGMFLTFFIIFAGIAIIAIAFSLLYSKAVVTITPKVANLTINGTFTAKKVNPAEAFPSGLTYDIVSSTDSETQPVSATDGPLIQSKSKGTITLYNEQTVQQKIVAGTRISNSDGLIYRTSATVVIPPSKTIPVAVVADQAGEEYNMSLNSASDLFKIVAYKGSAKYTTVYGKLKTALVGGFSGNKKIISPDVQSAVVQSIKSSLKTALMAKIQTMIPKGGITYDNAMNIVYDVSEPASKDKDTADITVKGTINLVVFNKDSLIKFIAKKELDKFPTTFDAKGAEELNFAIVNTKDFSYTKGTPIIFSLKGPMTLVGTFPIETLKNELKGTSLKQSNSIFSNYPTISNAYVLVTPFWMRSFPNSADKITIEIKKPI